MKRTISKTLLALALAASLNLGHAHTPNASDASALSMLPVAVVVAAPVALLSGGALLTVVAVEASADGVVCVLQGASDGARASLKLAGLAVGGASIAVGTVVTVTALGAGLPLSAAGQAIAFIPNADGAALLHSHRVSQ